MDVLRRLARGMSDPETGRDLFVGEATVKSHGMRIFDKLGVKDHGDRPRPVAAPVSAGGRRATLPM
jgi:DNA-binding NarL/FixJ family response regulator